MVLLLATLTFLSGAYVIGHDLINAYFTRKEEMLTRMISNSRGESNG